MISSCLAFTCLFACALCMSAHDNFEGVCGSASIFLSVSGLFIAAQGEFLILNVSPGI